jgi:hypothetical protein
MELVGIILPPIIDLINQFVTNKQMRFLVAFAFCALVGAGLNWIATQFVFMSVQSGFQSIATSILVVFGASQLTYNLGYSNSKVQQTIRGEQPLDNQTY